VELASKGVTAAGLDVLVAATVARTLTFLDLSSNRLGNVGVKILADNLICRSGPSSPLEALHLRDCFIGADGAFALAAALPSAPSLQLLDISDNMLQSRGVARIADALPSCSSLTHLLADSCYALSAGSAALARGAQGAPRLAHLSMANNHPGDAGYMCIAELIKSSPALHCIDASGTAVGLPRVCSGAAGARGAMGADGAQEQPADQGQWEHSTHQDTSESFGVVFAVDRSTAGVLPAGTAGTLAATSGRLSSALTTVMGETVFGHRRTALSITTVDEIASALAGAVATRVVHLRGLQLPTGGLQTLLQSVQGDPSMQQVGTLQELHLDENPVNPAYATACGDAALASAQSNWRLCYVGLHRCGLASQQLQIIQQALAQNNSRCQEMQANEGIHAAIAAEQQRVAALSSALAAEHDASTKNQVQLDRLRHSSLQLKDSLGYQHSQGHEHKASDVDASTVHSASDSLGSALHMVAAVPDSRESDFPGADAQLLRQLRDLRHTRAQLQESVPRASAMASSTHRSLHSAQEELHTLQSATAVARAQREAMLQEQQQLEADIAQLRRQQQESEEATAQQSAREAAARSAAAALKAQLEALQDSISAGHAELRAIRATRLAMSQDIIPAMHASEVAARRAAASAAQLEADLRGRLASTAALAEAVQHQVANERHRMTMLPQQQPAEVAYSSPMAARTILVSPRSDTPSSPVPAPVPPLPLQQSDAVNETIMPEEEVVSPVLSEPHVAEIAVGPDTPPPAAEQPPLATLPECLMDLVDSEGSALTVHCGVAMRSADELHMGSVTVHSVAWPPAQALRRESDGQAWSPDGRPNSDSDPDEQSDSTVVDLRGLYQFGVSPWDALLELRMSGGDGTPRPLGLGSPAASARSHSPSPAQLGSPGGNKPHSRRVSILSSWLSSVRVYTGEVTTVSLQCALVLPEVPSSIRLQLRNPDSAVALLHALLLHVPERLQRSVNEALQILEPPSPPSVGSSDDVQQLSEEGETTTPSPRQGGGDENESPVDVAHDVHSSLSVEVAEVHSPGVAGGASPGFGRGPLELQPAGHGSIDAPVLPSTTSTPHATTPYTPFSDATVASGTHTKPVAASPQPAAVPQADIIQARPPVTGFVLTEPPGWGQHNPISYSPREFAGAAAQAPSVGTPAVAAPPPAPTGDDTMHQAPGVRDAAAVPVPPDDASPKVVDSIRGYTWKLLQELWAAQTLPKYGELRKHVARQLNYGGGVLKGKEWRVWFRATVDDLLATLYAQTETAEDM